MFIYPLVINGMSKLNVSTGILILDCFLLVVLILAMFTVDIDSIKYNVTAYLCRYFTENTHKSIVLTSDEKSSSLKIRAIMYHITLLDDRTIYCLKEKIDTKWAYHDETQIEVKSEYSIDQTRPFTLDRDIHGVLKIIDKKKSQEKDKTEFTECSRLTIYSKHKSLLELQAWIDSRVRIYTKFQRNKTSAEQLLVTVMEGKNHELEVISAPWEATSTFENSYVPNADYLVKRIKFFINNKDWYITHGIPYTLGFLLHGPPGCGKTKFIKQIMNLTGRHGIDIKLNDKMDLNLLKQIIHNDQITDDLIIPQDQRILVFEDIDAMGDIVKSRDLKDGSAGAKAAAPVESASLSGFKIEGSKIVPIAPELPPTNNNNLSFLLNMIDGLNEGCGRILIMTTNKPDVLDKALIRPGRIDHIIEFGPCTLQDIDRMIHLYFRDEDDIPPENDLKPDLNKRHTAAEVMNMLRAGETFEDVRKIFYQKSKNILPEIGIE